MTETTPQDDGSPIKQRYGEISTRFFDYVTPLMLVTTGALLYLVVSHFPLIKGYYMHGPVLNSLMLVIVIVGLVMAYSNNISVYKTARFLHRLDMSAHRGGVTANEVHKLRVALEKEAHLLSMANFSALIGNLQTFSHLNITDNDARLVKSKFGARISHARTKVNYFCGILVMLGLIGTFWGLLDTITSVGKAMTMVSDNFAEQAKAGSGAAEIDMGGFLGSISKPLEGMGVGFSASLFGLAGSLFLGFINYLCGFPQNRFVEHFSRWLDDRIPSLPKGLSGKVKDARVPGGDDLKAWLAGFVFLANKTNQRMGQLFSAFTEANANTNRAIQHMEKLALQQQAVLSAMEDGNQKLGGLHLALKTFASDIVPSHLALHKIRDSVDHLSQAISSQANAQQTTMTAQMDHLVSMFSQVQQHTAGFAQLGEVQTGLLQEVRSLKLLPTPLADNRENEHAVSSLVTQVNLLLEELQQNGEDQLLRLFEQGSRAQSPESDKA